MTNVKYIVLDFDGTILNSDGETSKQLDEKLISLQEEGYKIILCSGRTYSGIEKVANKIKLFDYDGFIVAHNGSQIYEINMGKPHLIHDVKFTKKEVAEIYDAISDYGQSFVTYSENSMGATNIVDILHKSSKIMGLSLTKDFIQPTPKIILFDDPDKIIKMYKDVSQKIHSYNEKINVFSSVAHILEITPPSSQKGIALKKIAQLNNDTSKDFICFGDNGNDVSMFEYCKYSVAMENSIDEIHKIATHKTKSNNDDGVYHFLSSNFK